MWQAYLFRHRHAGGRTQQPPCSCRVHLQQSAGFPEGLEKVWGVWSQSGVTVITITPPLQFACKCKCLEGLLHVVKALLGLPSIVLGTIPFPLDKIFNMVPAPLFTKNRLDLVFKLPIHYVRDQGSHISLVEVGLLR